MINVTNLRNGEVFMYQDNPYLVIKYEHVKTARGGATVKLKVKGIVSGVIKTISLTSNDKVKEANVSHKNMQFLYKDNKQLYFMDETTYEQHSIAVELASNEAKFLVEGKTFQITFFNDNAVSIVLPMSMTFIVKEALPAVKGNTANSATKKITLENGLVVDAPQFIKVGDVVKINTTTADYINRVNK